VQENVPNKRSSVAAHQHGIDLRILPLIPVGL
jgi:hypothetical protein